MINKLKNYWEIFIILFLGLSPLLWYKNPNSLALGHDMGFPIDPIVFFKDRLFLWTDRVGLGWDQTLGSAAVLIHGFEALTASTGLPIFIVQKIVFIFWFVLPGLAMYYFVSTIHKEKEQWFIRLGASLFYMFNHFLLQAWFIAERTKISLFVALPLLLGLTINIIDRRISPLKGLALMALIFFFFNGGGGLPLYGGSLLALSLGFLFFAIFHLKKSFKTEFKRLSLLAFGIVSSFILANFYWILPTFIKTFFSYRESLSSIGGVSGVLAWSFEISKFASILNVIRLQGIPDWYDNPVHPYSKFFLENPFLVLISFIIPIIVFSSLLLVKKVPQYRKHIIFFNLLAVFGIIFTAGSHPPFGVIYNSFLSFIPGFAIFRTPFYKFAPALWFAYAYLFAFSFYYLTDRLKNFKTALRLIALPLILIYSFPFFTGSFFNWKEPFSTMTNLPSHVFSFKNWANSNLSFNDRVLTFPNQNIGWNTAIYRWGYWSTAPLETLLTNKSIITNDKVMTQFERKMVESVYESILEGTDDWEKTADFLEINYFLLHNDFYFDAPKFETEDPMVYEERFLQLGLKKKESFGEWDLYELPKSKDRISVESNPILILGANELLNDQFTDIDSIIDIPNNTSFYFTNDRQRQKEGIFSRNILIEKCLFCDKEDEKLSLRLPSVRILPGSIFYPLIEGREERSRKNVPNLNSQVDFHLGTSLKRISEIQRLIQLKHDDRTILATLKRLKGEIDGLKKIIDSLDKNKSFNRLTIKRIDDFLREENKILSDIAADSSENVRPNVLDLRVEIAEIYQTNQASEFTYDPNNDKIFHFLVDSSYNYEILLKGSNLSIEEFLLDGDLQKTTSATISSYLSFGKKFLNEGFHKLKFSLGNINNLLGQNDLNFKINPTNSQCRVFKLSVLPNKIYRLSFDYMTERSAGANNGPFVKIEKSGRGQDTNIERLQLKANSIFQSFNSKVATHSQTQRLAISICSSPGYEEVSTIEIRNLSLKDFIVPTAILVSENSVSSGNPTVSTEQINQSNYNVSVKGASSPYLLTLNNTFNSNWKLNSEDGDEEYRHITVNGFANGWIIDKKGDYTLNITYQPQKYFYWGWVVTFIFILSSIILIFYKRHEN